MAQTFSSLMDLMSHGYDTVIDVRSPAEFAEDHIPGAINLPVLSNEEHAIVGTIYKQESPFKARKIGGALVAKNTARHLEETLSEMEGSWRPLIYCWRGGQRSGFFSRFLQEVGWRAETVSGGYQTFRKLVHRILYDDPLDLKVVLLDGFTGTAKTSLLDVLYGDGTQTLDLEGLSNHRGSLLGELEGGQPSQKAFETLLATKITTLNREHPLLLEAESSKIGQINIPPRLWELMRAAPRIEITAPLKERAEYLVHAYKDILDDPERMAEKLQPLRQFRGHEIVDNWESLLAADDRIALVSSLMSEHYDPSYARSRNNNAGSTIKVIDAPSLADRALKDIAAEIRQALKSPELLRHLR